MTRHETLVSLIECLLAAEVHIKVLISKERPGTLLHGNWMVDRTHLEEIRQDNQALLSNPKFKESQDVPVQDNQTNRPN